jgi:hypothetical protein
VAKAPLAIQFGAKQDETEARVLWELLSKRHKEIFSGLEGFIVRADLARIIHEAES